MISLLWRKLWKGPRQSVALYFGRRLNPVKAKNELRHPNGVQRTRIESLFRVFSFAQRDHSPRGVGVRGLRTEAERGTKDHEN